MIKNDKLLQIYNSFKYKSIHPYKYFILKNRYKKIRIKSFEALKSSDFAIDLSKDKNFKIFSQYKDEYLYLEKIINKKKELVKEKYNVDIHGIHYPELIYFLIRLIKPTHVIETGVWLGLSTQFILSAGIKNEKNFMLDSIDLPRLNLENPEKFLGLLVNKELKENWALHIGTDRQKLRKLLKKSPAEIFYFDSDKTHNGKMYLYNTVKKYRDNYLMIFDDVEDNLFWFDKKIKLEQRVLINYQNKYIGIMYTNKFKDKLQVLYE